MNRRKRFCVLALLLAAWGTTAIAADGDLDPVFGGGVAHAPLTSFGFDPVAVAIQQDGKFVLCTADYDTQHLFLSRFETSGEIDDSFGNDGVAATGILVTMNSRVKLAVKADSSIVVAAYSLSTHDLFVMQFQPSGFVDFGFGVNGIAWAGVWADQESGFDIAITSRDKVVLAGVDNARHEVFLVKITVDGLLDTGFGDGNARAYAGVFAGNDADVSVDTYPGGGILVASIDGASGHLYAARFDWAGNLEPEFGVDGISAIDIYCEAHAPAAVEIDSSFHVYIASSDAVSHDFFAARLDEWGALDAGFGDAGIVHTGIPSSISSKMALATQAGGELLVAGRDVSEPDYYLCRFDSLGNHDAGFGEAGVAHLGIFGIDVAPVALAVYPDDRILLAGQDLGMQRAFVARYASNGRLDQAEFLGGRAYTDLPQPGITNLATAILPDGDVLLAGITGDQYYFVQRYEPTGLRSPDFWWGGNLVLEDIYTGRYASVDILNIPGTTDFYLIRCTDDYVYLSKMFIQRFHGDGSIDTDFGSGLPVEIGINISPHAGVAIAALADGRVRLAGMEGPIPEHFLVGLLANGDLDPGFGVGGVVMTDIWGHEESGVDLMITDLGDILLAGIDSFARQAFVMRFNGSGALDTEFGVDGIAYSGIQSTGSSSIDVGLARSSAGLSLASLCDHDGQVEYFVARFTGDGVLDPGFGVGGIAYTGVATLKYLPVAIASQSDRKIVLAGVTPDGVDWRNAFVRLDVNGALDTEFGNGGVTVTSIPAASFKGAVSLEVQEDGNILAAGRDLDQGHDYLVRLLATPDIGTAVPEGSIPVSVLLNQNYPNPFNPSTTISFFVPEATRATLTIFDVAGRRVVTLFDGHLPSGSRSVSWDGVNSTGQNVSTGVYFCRLEAGGAALTRKIVLIK